MNVPDFFNNVAAVAVVIMFAKAVTHRSRSRRPGRPDWLSRIHVLGVCAAVASASVALIATETQEYSAWWFHVAAWGTLAVAGATLVADEYLEMRTANSKSDSRPVIRNTPIPAPASRLPLVRDE